MCTIVNELGRGMLQLLYAGIAIRFKVSSRSCFCWTRSVPLHFGYYNLPITVDGFKFQSIQITGLEISFGHWTKLYNLPQI